MSKKISDYYFLSLFSLIPIAIIIGPTISLINILLIDISFIFILIKSQNFLFLKKKPVILILIICVYLIFNSLISQDSSIGLKRNFGFIRFLILFIAFNYFFLKKDFFKKVFLVWLIVITLACVDIYIEHFFGKNILGYAGSDAKYGDRIVSFFKDEPIIGTYLNAFYLLLIGFVSHLLGVSSYKKRLIILIFSIILFFSILLTGERSPLIKAFLALMIFYFINDSFNIKEKIFLVTILFFVSLGIFANSSFLKSRLLENNSISFFKSSESIKNTNLIVGNENLYLTLFRSGLTVWKNYPLFGVGNKNYRIVTCKKSELIKFPEYICGNHPHQIYVEFLSEHGIIGGLILLTIIFKLIFKNLPILIKSKNYVQLGCFVFLLNVFLPLIPSGAFFGDFSSNFFWINMSILYASNPNTNIFKNSNMKF